MNEPKLYWQSAENNRFNLVTEHGLIVAYVQRLSDIEWAWDVLRYPNAYGRKHNKKQAQAACIADWERVTKWTQG